MVENRSSGKRKPGKKRQSITYKTSRERKRHKGASLVEKAQETTSNEETNTVQTTASNADYGTGEDPMIKRNSNETKAKTSSRKQKGDKRSHSNSSCSSVKALTAKVDGNKLVSRKPTDGKSIKVSKSDAEKVGENRQGRTAKLRRKSINYGTSSQRRKKAKSIDEPETSKDVSLESTANEKEKKSRSQKDSSTSSVELTSESRQMNISRSQNSLPRTIPGDGKNIQRKRPHLSKSAHQTSSYITPKRQKTSRVDENEQSSSNTLPARRLGTRVKTRSRNSQVIPDRIKDLKVTKKAYDKWKPLAKSTREYVDHILKSVVLNVIADTNAKENGQAVKCLTMLKDRVLERLPHLKAPYTQDDYRKMESQNKESDEKFFQKSQELNDLDKRIEEEHRLLESQTKMITEFTAKLKFCKKELYALENEKAHPLIRQTKDVLGLPKLDDKSFKTQETSNSGKQCEMELNNLSQTLVKLKEKVTSHGMERWMNRLERLTEDLHEK